MSLRDVYNLKYVYKSMSTETKGSFFEVKYSDILTYKQKKSSDVCLVCYVGMYPRDVTWFHFLPTSGLALVYYYSTALVIGTVLIVVFK